MSAGETDRTARRVVFTLCAVVALGCLFFGAPPRFGRAHGAPELFALFLESLTPLMLVQTTVCACALALLVRPVRDGFGRPSLRSPVAPLALLTVMALLSLVPLPRFLLGLVAPFSAETYAHVADDGWRARTLWSDGTWTALLTLTGMLVAVCAVTRSVRADRASGDATRTARALLVFVALAATLECAYGFYETKFGTDGYLGLAKLSGRGRVTGTFVHGTMLAVWAGMGACAAAALCARSFAAHTGVRRLRALGWAGVVVFTVAGAQFSLSRLGFVAAGCGLVVTVFCAGRALRDGGARKVGALFRAGAVLAPALGVALVLAVPRFRERIDYVTDWFRGVDVPEEPRLAMWSSTLDLAAHAPVLGVGPGAYGRAIHLVQSDRVPQELWFAHSDLLNLYSDAGLVGLALGLWFVVAMFVAGRSAVRGGDAATRTVAAGATGAAIVVLVAALGDFQTQFAVVAIPFAALFAVPVALSGAAPGGEGVATARTSPRTSRAVAALLAALLLAALARGVFQWGARLSHVRAGHAPAATYAERELTLGRELVERRDASLLPEALAHFTRASRADPLLDAAHLWRGVVLLQTGERDAGLLALGRARWVSRGHTDVNLLAGQLYLRLLGAAPAPGGPPGDGATAALREAGALSPAAFEAAFAAARAAGLDDAALRALVPDRAHAWLTWSEYAARAGDAAGALTACENAVRSEPRHVVARLRLVRALLAAGRVDDAAPHAGRALALSVDDPRLVEDLAREYVAAGAEGAGRAVFGAAAVAWPEGSD